MPSLLWYKRWCRHVALIYLSTHDLISHIHHLESFTITTNHSLPNIILCMLKRHVHMHINCHILLCTHCMPMSQGCTFPPLSCLVVYNISRPHMWHPHNYMFLVNPFQWYINHCALIFIVDETIWGLEVTRLYHLISCFKNPSWHHLVL